MHKAELFQKLPKGLIRCTACGRFCQIKKGNVGFCLSRQNLDGQLYSLNYGFSSGLAVDPIEKKPFYHFYPGTQVLSLGSWGCNFRCKQCQNWDCSWGKEATSRLSDLSNLGDLKEEYLSPKALVKMAVTQGYPGLAFTYNEPAIGPEYVRDAAVLAKKAGLYTTFVSNGSWSQEALEFYGSQLDAANIDLKGWGEKAYNAQGAFWGQILEDLKIAFKKYKIHLELTTLIIPGINDDSKDLKAMAEWIVKNLGPEIPWHLSRYSPFRAPDKKFRQIPPTPTKDLKRAYEIGKNAGLHFVYVWAPPEGKESFLEISHTICPKCGRLTIERNNWQSKLVGVKKVNGKGICKYCGQDLYLKI